MRNHTDGVTDGFIETTAYPGVGAIEAAIATTIGAILIAIGWIFELAPCSGFAAALIGLGVICFGIAIAVGLPGSWVFPSMFCGAGVITLLYGLSAASAAGCLPTGI
jgi:hypothetical protein